MSLASLFSGVNFASTIRRYASDHRWTLADVNDRRAVLKFEMKSGRTQTLYIIRYDTTLEFSVPSMAAFDSEDQIPHIISTLLLKRSSQLRIGFWCIEEIAKKQVYSYMHNAELQLIDSDYFGSVVRVLVTECDELEQLLEDMV